MVVTVKYQNSGKVSQDVWDLRHRTLVEEARFLPAKEIDADRDLGTHISVYIEDQLAGTTQIMLGEESDFDRYVGCHREDLIGTVYSTRTCVEPTFRGRGVFSLLIYLAARWGRTRGRKNFVGFVEEGEPPIAKLLRCHQIPGTEKRKVLGTDGQEYQLCPVDNCIDYVMHRCFETMPKAMKEWTSRELFLDELQGYVEHGIFRLYESSWFVAVELGTLTRSQYVRAIANLHQYVRWTTRLVANMIWHTQDPEIRGHLVGHLNGEIDHEVMLENDLKALGADSDFVVNAMAPDAEILKFMALQQSLPYFDEDPVLFLVAPFVAEGYSAKMDRRFLSKLESCIASWGVEKPRRAMSFLASHIHTDGGDDGHWQAVANSLKGQIKMERTLQSAIRLVEAFHTSMFAAYEGYMKSWGLEGKARPVTETQQPSTSRFDDESSHLLCNRAVAISCENDPERDDILPATTATGLTHGWVWDIHLRSRNGCGYVYSDEFTTPEAAEDELRTFLGPRSQKASTNHIRMRIGSSRKWWHKNCVAIGLSGSFIEPLESTGIFLIEYGISSLVSFFPDAGMSEVRAEQYNRVMRDMYVDTRDFVVLHYTLNGRSDSRFWECARHEMTVPPSLQEKISWWQENLPILDRLKLLAFGPCSYAAVLDGCNALPRQGYPILEHIGYEQGEQALEELRIWQDELCARLPGHYEYLREQTKRQYVF